MGLQSKVKGCHPAGRGPVGGDGEVATVPNMRFNHMEMTLARGTLDDGLRADLEAFYGGVLGWQTGPYELFGQKGQLLRPDDDQFILVMEVDDPVRSPSYDHLGLLVDGPEEVDELLDACRRFQQKDGRLAIKELDDLTSPQVVCHAFYVRYLLPFWFDVQSLTYRPGATPARRWELTGDGR